MYFRRRRIDMARRRSRGKKIQPAVMKMHFAYTATDGSKQSQHIDLSQCASLLNRRFYRQGLNWAVARIKLTTEGGTGFASVHKLPNTWIMSNAWEKSFRTWQQMVKEATDETSVKPKFLDYKIYMNEDHHNVGFDANLLPTSAATLTGPGQVAKLGEWSSAKFIIPNTTNAAGGILNMEAIAVGDSFPGAGATGLDAVSIIQGYANSRALPNIQDPNSPDDADNAGGNSPDNWMAAMTNDGTLQDQVVLDDLITENTQAPYPFENGTDPSTGLPFGDTQYPGGANNLGSLEIHDQNFITTTTVGGATNFDGGNFPCGLIELQTSGFKSGDGLLWEITLVPGNHRGYLAESMTEM